MSGDALIGATGFVGSNLRASRVFSDLYNSANIHQSADRRFDSIVCAAAPGSMVAANRAPQQDEAAIDNLISHLRHISAGRAVLISTIATLTDFGVGQTEDTSAFEEVLAYGRNRRKLETFFAGHFQDHLIVRLPALFGPGLRKNLIFDLLNPAPSMLTEERREQLSQALPADLWRVLGPWYVFEPATGMWTLDRSALDGSAAREQIEAAIETAGFEALRFTNPASTFQFFDLSLLSDTIDRAQNAGIRTLHVAPEPLSANAVVRALRGAPMQESKAKVHTEDMRTRHANLFGRSGQYGASADDVLQQLTTFVNGAR